MRKLMILATPLIAAGLAACGGGSGKAEWDESVRATQSWETLQPKEATEEVAVEDAPVEIVSESIASKDYSCQVTRTELKTSPDDFVTIDPDKSIIWLGNLIQGQSHYSKGSLQELTIRERAPMRVTIDLLRGDNWREVDQPSLATVQSAIGELVDLAVKDGHEASATASFKSSEIHSTEQALLEVGITGEYMGSSASGSFSGATSAGESAHMATLIQRAFTVSIEHPANPADVLSASFSSRDLAALNESGALAGENPPLYISGITYGRVLVYSMRARDESSRVKAAIEASYRGTASVDAYAKGEIEDTLRRAEIDIAAFGGKQENIEALIRSGTLKDYFSEDTQLTSMVPISFELRRLSDGQIAHITRTTEYDVKTCTNVTQPIGEEIRFTLSSFKIRHDCEPGPNKGDIYGNFYLHWEDQDGNLTRSKLFDYGRNSPVKVQSGSTLKVTDVPGEGVTGIVDVERYPGKTFKLVGTLSEADKGLNLNDDTVGKWSVNLASKGQGDSNATGGSHCTSKSNNRPIAYYSLEKTGDIYP